MKFEKDLPSNSDLAKTVTAFANDAGGDIYIGVNDSPRERNRIVVPSSVYKKNYIGNVGNDVDDSEMMLIDCIKRDNSITIKTLPSVPGLSKRQCERIISDLRKKGVLSRTGNNRTGSWIVNK